jgi:hypothetical protein
MELSMEVEVPFLQKTLSDPDSAIVFGDGDPDRGSELARISMKRRCWWPVPI